MAFDLSYTRRLYDWWGKHPAAYSLGSWLVFLDQESSLRGKAVSLIGLEAGETVLDLACGNGINFELLEKKVSENGQIIGFDYSQGMLQFAAKRSMAKGWRNIQLVQGDAASIDLPKNSLDGAFCSLGLSAMPDHKTAIQSVFKALKPEKCFVVLDAKPFGGWAKIFNPIIRPMFKFSTNWNYYKDIVGSLNETFGSVKTYSSNSGSIFIAVGTKTGENGG